MLEVLLFALLAIVGWLVSRRRAAAARRFAQITAMVAIAASLVVIGSGVLRDQRYAAGIHRWTGQTILVLTWLGVPFSLGVVFARDGSRRTGRAIVQSSVLLTMLGLSTLCSVTGYLGPSYGDYVGEETEIRFQVLHKMVLPAMLFLTLLGWCWMFRSRDGEREGRVGRREA